MNRPYTQEIIDESVIIRTFSGDVDEFELKWHWDEDDRLVEIIGSTDWLFQFDNELPIEMKDPIFIPKGNIHRVIKGSGELKVKIYKK
jgi:hypothetical protein